MKKLHVISLVILLLVFTFTMCCKKDDHPIKIKFEADFLSEGAEDAFKEMCEPPASETDFWGKDHQVGAGTAKDLGSLIFDSYFCFHVVLNENGPDFDNGFGEYESRGLEGYFEFKNGDRLYLDTPSGKVLPAQEPGYRFEFHDIVNVVGGTGRFAGAWGKLDSNGLVGESGTEHHWTGKIYVPV